MGNPTKTTGIFTRERNILDEKEKKLLKENFSVAQMNGSIMWQEVYSFDNKWLEQQMLYDPRTNYLDEGKIKNAIRKSIEYSLEKTDMKESALWSGAIHYNTDNIHIHVAICEPNKTKHRGKRTQKTLDMMKSKFINHLLDFDNEYKEINKLLRDDLVKSARNFDISKDIEMKRLIQEVIKNLPSDSRHWHYNYNTMKDSNKHLDKLTKYYIKNYKFDEYKELINKLDKHEEELKNIYGVGKRQKYKEYKKNKIDEFIEWEEVSTIDPTIKSLNKKCADIKEDTLDYIFRKIDLNQRDKKILDKMLSSALKRMIREPILNLKHVKNKGKREEYIKAIEELFDI